MPSPPLRRGPVRVYKNRDAGHPRKAPRCICCFPESRAGQRIPLRYGVTLVLCAEHRDPAFVRSHSGRRFYASVTTTFTSLGLTGARYERAVRGFIDQALGRGERPRRARPGSYAWPDLRRLLEQVWSSGGDYHAAERRLARYAAGRDGSWPFPSPHTVRRWWREKRWLFGPADAQDGKDGRPSSPCRSPWTAAKWARPAVSQRPADALVTRSAGPPAPSSTVLRGAGTDPVGLSP